MRPVIMIALMLRIIDTFRTFDVIWLMTQGGPGGATNRSPSTPISAGVPGGVDFGHAAAGLLHRAVPVVHLPRPCSTACPGHGTSSGGADDRHRSAWPASRAGAAARKYRDGITLGLVVRYRVLIGTVLLTVFPLVWLVLTSLRSSADIFAVPVQILPETVTFNQYVTRLQPVRHAQRLSLEHGHRVGRDRGAGDRCWRVPCAYAMARFRLPGRQGRRHASC